MDLLKDHNLMLKVKEGDVDKLSLLYERYSRRFFGFFYGMTNDGATSEDLVQNVFIRILKYKHTYRDSGNFEVWAFQLARNVHHDHFRKTKRYTFKEDMHSYENILSEKNSKENSMERSDEIDYLLQAMNGLSNEKRELIELVRFQKMKYHKVAALMGVTEAAIKVRVHRALKELRALYLKLDV